ncbi:MAG: hypothetical protein AAB402_04455 [Patescibacteria group bacterium]
MKRCTVLFAMAIFAVTAPYPFTSTVQADTLQSTLTLLQTVPLAQTDTPADVTAKPAIRSTWGAIKALYRGNSMDPNAMTQDSTSAGMVKPGAGTMATYGGDWSNNIISEVYYSLNKYRTGTSGVVYQGLALSDWGYARDDTGALNAMTIYIGSGNRGGIDGTWNRGSRGGYCKFFVDLVLYRSSYGIGGGYHLVLPAGTFNYGSYMPAYGVQQATRGMVIQRGGTYPHTAIVVANLGWGLDLIDSNFTGGDGNYVISRHALAWTDLAGYTAYRATYMRQF